MRALGGLDRFDPKRGAAGVDQVRVGRDLAEAPGPVVTAAGKDLDGVVVDVELDAIAVELDFMDPPIAGRRWRSPAPAR